MIFRYKIKHDVDGIDNNHYVKIQQYEKNALIFHWKTVAKPSLRKMVYKVGNIDVDDTWEITAAQLYAVLSRYNCMGDFVKKYITDILLPSYEEQKCTDWIANFTSTNGWEHIEIEEDKE